MKLRYIYQILLKDIIQKLIKPYGANVMMVSKMMLVVVLVGNVTGAIAQSRIGAKTVKVLDLPQLKQYEYLPDVVQDMPLELQYFNGKPNIKTSFRDLSENFVQLFFWDASYADHLTDLKKIYDNKEEMGNMSTFILVISKCDKRTLARVASALERFKKEYEVDMNIACIIGNPNLDKLFNKVGFPKYVQVNNEAVFVDEKPAQEIFKNRERRK